MHIGDAPLDAPLPARRLPQLLNAAERAQALEHAAAERALQVEQEAARKAAEDALAEAAAKRKKDKAQGKSVDPEAVQRLVAELEQHLEEGRLAEAEADSKQIEHALGGGALAGQLARRLQRARAQTARLLGWARWGTDQARVQLIGVAEALLRGEPDIDECARAVPLLRKEWKNLDAHGAGSQAAWKRFDRALEKAYKPVAELRAAEAAVHAAARAAWVALCEAWDTWLAENVGADPDAKLLEAKRDEVIAAWRSAPRAGFRDERQLRKRFDVLLNRIDTPLEAARAAELARREALVAAAEALAAETDLGRALSAAKTLQRRWKGDARAMRLKQGAEQKLWQRFRKACDAVFERRDSEQAAEAQQRAERDAVREAELNAVREVEARKKEKHAARFAALAAKADAAASVQGTSADADVFARGLAQRAALLLDLEIALELPTPESHTGQRRTRILVRLQDRFRAGAAAPQDPEKMVAQWYAIAAPTDDGHVARMAAIVQKLLQPPAQSRPAQSRPAASRPTQSRPSYARKDSRS